jgi:hypothetical protein
MREDTAIAGDCKTMIILRLWREANLGFAKVNAKSSQALYKLTSFLPIILYSSWIAYDKPSYLLDDFSGSHLCSRVDPLPYNPARLCSGEATVQHALGMLL